MVGEEVTAATEKPTTNTTARADLSDPSCATAAQHHLVRRRGRTAKREGRAKYGALREDRSSSTAASPRLATLSSQPKVTSPNFINAAGRAAEAADGTLALAFRPTLRTARTGVRAGRENSQCSADRHAERRRLGSRDGLGCTRCADRRPRVQEDRNLRLVGQVQDSRLADWHVTPHGRRPGLHPTSR